MSRKDMKMRDLSRAAWLSSNRLDIIIRRRAGYMSKETARNLWTLNQQLIQAYKEPGDGAS